MKRDRALGCAVEDFLPDQRICQDLLDNKNAKISLLNYRTNMRSHQRFELGFREIENPPDEVQNNMKKESATTTSESPSRLIDARIKELNDWRGKTLARVRALIKQAVPEVVEEWKWRGVPVWSHDGIICTGETYKRVVKLTFAKGASVKDPKKLFNSSLDGNVRRAIDIHEGDEIDEAAFKALIADAAALNKPRAKKRA